MTKNTNLRSSTVRTAMLMSLLLAVWVIGGYAYGGMTGLFAFAAFGLMLNFATYWFSDRLALIAHRAQPCPREQAPTLYAIVERLSAEAQIPTPPIYIIPSDSPNAFATGRGPGHAAVAVTRGLLNVLDERELEAVLSHELSHVRNRDVLVATVAAGIAGLVASLGHVLRWSLLIAAAGGNRNTRRGSDTGALAFILVAPIIALLLQLAISRTREYGADASGARLSGEPGALADALEKLEAESERRPYEFAGPATAHLFIVNPLRGASARVANLMSTHPPIEQRIARLRAMAA